MNHQRFPLFLQSLLTLLLLSSVSYNIQAQKGHHIDITIKNLQEKEVYLGYHLGNNKYAIDTLALTNGKYTAQGDDTLKPGMYLILIPPANNYFDILIETDNQHFSIETEKDQYTDKTTFKKSPANTAFYEYTQFITRKIKETTPLHDSLRNNPGNTKLEKQLRKELADHNKEVKTYQDNVLKKYKNSLLASLIKASSDVEIPDMSAYLSDKELARWRLNYMRQHYFDNVNWSDGRLMRTPFIENKINAYLDNYFIQTPDSLVAPIDTILKKATANTDILKFTTVTLINKYFKSNIVSMDALYVYIMKEYYLKGRCPWANEEQLAKMRDDVARLEPILVGKIAPNVTMQTFDGKEYKLHDVKARFTVLYFWAPDCHHCEKSAPKMREFYDLYHPKGVEVFAVCSKLLDEYAKCPEKIEEWNFPEWLNVGDRFYQSKYKQVYDVVTTPAIFLLDANKKIIAKKIGAEQLGKIIDHELELEQKRLRN